MAVNRDEEALRRAYAAERSPVFSEMAALSGEARPLASQLAVEWVIVFCPRWNDDGSANAVELLYGDNSRQRCDLLPGNSTLALPFKDLAEVYVKTVPDPDTGDETALQVPFLYMPKL